MKENITRKVRPCRKCGEPTAEYDGYCETCFPPESSPDDQSEPLNNDLLGKWQKGDITL